MKRKRGFTSIELLSVVIVISIFAFIAIFGIRLLITSTAKDSLVTEAKNLVRSASVAAATLNVTEQTCFTFKYLSDHGYYTSSIDNISGSILVTTKEETRSYRIWVLSNDYGYDGYSVPSDLELVKDDLIKLDSISETCGDFEGTIY